KANVAGDIERMAVADALRAIRLAHVVILVIDASMGLEKQDAMIAAHTLDEGRALVIAANKWDLAQDKTAELDELEYQIKTSLSQAQGVPLVTISARSGLRVEKLMAAALDVYGLWNARAPTGKLNRWLRAMEDRNPPPASSGRANRLRYITQVKARP